jgi:uncharacterized protein (TIGR02284 family)
VQKITVKDEDETGTIVGAVHRTWGDLKAKLGGSDHTLLETAEGGEEVAVHRYTKALEKELVIPIRSVLEKQRAQLVESFEYVKAMREATE